MPNAVTWIAAARPDEAIAHFEEQFKFETDCWDTHDALKSGAPGFVLLSDHADLAAGDHGSGEDLMDHSCRVLGPGG